MEKCFTFLGENHSHYHAINTKNTSHDHWNDGFHYNFRFQDSHTADPDTTFSCTIGSSEVWNLRIGVSELDHGTLLAKIKAQATPKYPKKKQ